MNRSSCASGSGIGALLLDRVLGRQHEERIGQVVGGAAGGDLVLLHRLEQRGLGLGRRAVDLVGQHDVGEDRALHEPERAPAGGQVLLDDVGAGDVARHQVGRELDPVERQVERLRHGLHHQRLGQAGHADQQGVAAAQDGGEDALDDVVLADDPLGDLAAQPGDRLGQALELLDVVVLDAGHAVAVIGSRR